MGCVYLDETDVLGVLPEALTAHVEAILADQAVSVAAHPAAHGTQGCQLSDVRTYDRCKRGLLTSTCYRQQGSHISYQKWVEFVMQ